MSFAISGVLNVAYFAFEKMVDNIVDKEELIERDGHRYYGKFKDSLLEGLGWHEFQDQTRLEVPTRLEGFFVKNELHGPGKITHPNNSVWEGEFENGRFVYGTMTNPQTKSKKIGHFANGVLHGFGKHIWANGQVDEGIFENGRFTYKEV